MDGVGIVGGEPGRQVETVNFILHGVGAAGGHTLHFKLHGERIPRCVLRFAHQDGVVPGFTGNGHAVFVRPCFGDIGKLRADGAGRKTKPEGQVLRVDAQVSHTAVFSVGCTHALPVDGFCQIHVGGMLDGEACLDDLPECALAVPFYHLLYGGIEWKFAGAPYKYLGATGHGGLHLLAGRKVHAERFFPDEVFSRADDVAVHLCVQVVGHRAVYGLHLGIGQQLVIIAVKVLCVRHLAEPVEIFWREVARSNNDGAGQLACQMQPAHGDAGEFAAHQAAADHTEAHGFHIHRAAPFCAAVSASALSNRATSLPAIVSVVMSGSFVRATGGQLGL